MGDAYILASLEDDKAKELGQVIANETTRKILNFLTIKPATSSEISKELKQSLSTISYNIQQLLKAGLIKINGTFYSGKGKTVNVYAVSKKVIMIVPQGVSLFKRKIKSIIPAILLGFFVSVFIKIFYSSKLNFLFTAQEKAVDVAAGAIKETANEVPQITSSTFSSIASITTNYAAFFFVGALIGISVYLIIEYVKEKKKK
jgi:predicted transcriptional regulator